MKNFLNSFKYAINGIVKTIKNERNIKVHIIIMIMAIILGITLRISLFEWEICILLFGAVISMEIINTAIEKAVDLACNEKNELAKISKDVAAGAVLIMAIASAIIGIIIFLPKILNLL